MLYRIVMSLHIVAVISWMAGTLYLIRLFVYHAAEKERVVKERFVMMEDKLYRIITVPAMVVAFGLGLTMLILNPILWKAPWMHAKLFFVLCLIGVTVYSGKVLREFRAGSSPHPEKFFRLFNELPTLLMIFIVFLVILKPF